MSVCIAFACGTAVAEEAHPQKNILYLSAEGLDHPYFAAAFSAFKDELEQALPRQTVVYVENLDLAKFTGKAYRASLKSWLRDKYADARIDAIVTAGSPTLQFIAESHLWPDVPTYYSNANDAIVRTIALPSNFTGQTFTVNFGQTIGLIRKVLPATRRIVLVGNAPQDDVYRPFFGKELDESARGFGIDDLRGKPVDEVLKVLSSLGSDSVIYRFGFSRTRAGQVLDSFTLWKMTAAAASRPVFVDYTPFIGTGALGGVAIDPASQGRNAGRKIAEILNGAAPSSLPVTRVEPQPIFDWRELKRWNIPESSLPAGTQVWFYTPSAWERYRWQIAGAGTLIALLTSLVVALLVERRRRAIAVAESRARLAELAHLNRNATAMVYSGAIAHELNQPLAAILANAQAARMMLAMQPPAMDDIREILEDIERDDQRASELIRGMRGLLKKGEVRHELVDLNDVVSRAVRFIRPEAAVRQVGLRMRLPDNPVEVLGDRVQLQQVLINLVINGMDAMAGAPVATRIVEIGVYDDQPDEVRLSVTDAGPGFACDMEHLFTSFTTTKAHGTGLGLAITAALVREHGGTIAAANPAGGGAQVTITLPRAGRRHAG